MLNARVKQHKKDDPQHHYREETEPLVDDLFDVEVLVVDVQVVMAVAVQTVDALFLEDLNGLAVAVHHEPLAVARLHELD